MTASDLFRNNDYEITILHRRYERRKRKMFRNNNRKTTTRRRRRITTIWWLWLFFRFELLSSWHLVDATTRLFSSVDRKMEGVRIERDVISPESFGETNKRRVLNRWLRGDGIMESWKQSQRGNSSKAIIEHSLSKRKSFKKKARKIRQRQSVEERHIPSSPNRATLSLAKATQPNNQNNQTKETTNPIQIQPRIIGGTTTHPNQYPFMASLTYTTQHVCGGTLIAPDLILTAAHCLTYFNGIQLGRYDVSDKTEVYEHFVVDTFEIHPKFDPSVLEGGEVLDFDYDFMVVKVFGYSEERVVSLNRDESVPSRKGESLWVMGWGDVDPSHLKQDLSDVLREVEVKYVLNEQCERAKGYMDGDLMSYEGLINDASLCASDLEEDACQGDSGGPLIQRGMDGEVVQVGVVSWGNGCANPSFPGVYSRISNQIDWITEKVCSMSENPPASFRCPKRPMLPPSEQQVILTVQITFDKYAKETGWILKRVEDGKIFGYRPVGYYGTSQTQNGPYGEGETAIEQVTIDKDGREYSFVLLDSYGDGQSYSDSSITHRLYMGPDPFGEVIVSGGGDFKFSLKYTFFISNTNNSNSPPAITTTTPPSTYPTNKNPLSPQLNDDSNTRPPYHLTILLKFDNFPEEIGWTLSSITHQTNLASKPLQSYGDMPYGTVSEKVTLFGIQQGGVKHEYMFTILDSGYDGLCCRHGSGYYEVYLGRGQEEEEELYFRGDVFGGIEQYILTVLYEEEEDGGIRTPTMSPNLNGVDITQFETSVQEEGGSDAVTTSSGSKLFGWKWQRWGIVLMGSFFTFLGL